MNGRLVRAATRGDGVTGEDVTTLVLALIDDVPHTLPTASNVEVRGEAVMRRSVFDAYNASHTDQPLVNMRSRRVGAVR